MLQKKHNCAKRDCDNDALGGEMFVEDETGYILCRICSDALTATPYSETAITDFIFDKINEDNHRPITFYPLKKIWNNEERTNDEAMQKM